MKTICQPPVRRYVKSGAQDMTARLPTVAHGMCSWNRLVESGSTDLFVALGDMHDPGRRAIRPTDHPDNWGGDGPSRRYPVTHEGYS
jgi:hypothetical protein